MTEQKSIPTRLTVRALSCDAKIIGSLVGGCRVTVRHRETGEVLAQGKHLGGSGDTDSIMKASRVRGSSIFSSPGTASFQAELALSEPTPVEVVAEGPLAYPHALQKAVASTWLIPGRHLEGDGLVLQLYGFIVEIMEPDSVDVLHSHDPFHLLASVRLL